MVWTAIKLILFAQRITLPCKMMKAIQPHALTNHRRFHSLKYDNVLHAIQYIFLHIFCFFSSFFFLYTAQIDDVLETCRETNQQNKKWLTNKWRAFFFLKVITFYHHWREHAHSISKLFQLNLHYVSLFSYLQIFHFGGILTQRPIIRFGCVRR